MNAVVKFIYEHILNNYCWLVGEISAGSYSRIQKGYTDLAIYIPNGFSD
jgi:hypothetical protein